MLNEAAMRGVTVTFRPLPIKVVWRFSEITTVPKIILQASLFENSKMKNIPLMIPLYLANLMTLDTTKSDLSTGISKTGAPRAFENPKCFK